MGTPFLPFPSALHGSEASLADGVAVFPTANLDAFDQPFFLSGGMMGREKKKSSLS